MLRRTFLKAVAVTVAGTTVRLRPTVDRESLLRAFCDSDDVGNRLCFRYDVSNPFSVGSLTYATDASSLVRAELSAPELVAPVRVPPVGEVFRQMWLPCGWRSFELPDPEHLTLGAGSDGGICPVCDDRRIVLPHYPDADEMSGPKWCDASYDVDSNSIRDATCPACHGRPWRGPWLVDVFGVRMAYSRLKPIAAIPDVAVTISRYDAPMILFRGAGLEGVAMGTQYD